MLKMPLFTTLLMALLLAASAQASNLPADMAAVIAQESLFHPAEGHELGQKVWLQKGENVTISLELSDDRQLFVDVPGIGPGRVDRDDVSWPDGSPVKGSPYLDEKTTIVSAAGLTAEPSGDSVSRPSSKAPADSEKGHKSRSHRARKNPGIPELLLGLISDASPDNFPEQVAKDKHLSKEEKVFALRVYYKYIRERQSDLSADDDATAEERAAVEAQSKKLIDSLAKLQSDATAMKGKTKKSRSHETGRS